MGLADNTNNTATSVPDMLDDHETRIRTLERNYVGLRQDNAVQGQKQDDMGETLRNQQVQLDRIGTRTDQIYKGLIGVGGTMILGLITLIGVTAFH